MLLVCYTNHFNHRICRVLEEPLTPPLPALRFKVAIHLQLHSVCWIPYVHFHFFWRSHLIPRSSWCRCLLQRFHKDLMHRINLFYRLTFPLPLPLTSVTPSTPSDSGPPSCYPYGLPLQQYTTYLTVVAQNSKSFNPVYCQHIFWKSFAFNRIILRGIYGFVLNATFVLHHQLFEGT